MKRAGDVISALFDEGFVKKAGEYSALFSCWKDLMEKNGIAAAADHSRVKNIERGIVWVEADHPGWKQLLQTKQSKLLSDFCRRFPDLDISGLSISLYKPGTQKEKDLETGKYNHVDLPTENLSVKSIVTVKPADNNLTVYDTIKDETLKQTLKRLEKNILKRNTEKN